MKLCLTYDTTICIGKEFLLPPSQSFSPSFFFFVGSQIWSCLYFFLYVSLLQPTAESTAQGNTKKRVTSFQISDQA